LLKTENKVWGVCCLNDIPRGTFIFCYFRNILTETNATDQGKNYGDEYLTGLDFIEKVEKYKEVLFKSKHSYSNETFLESITKDETSHRIVKIVSKNSSCESYIGNVIRRIQIQNPIIGDVTKPV